MFITSDDYKLLEQSTLIYYVKIEVKSIGNTINENTTIIDSLEGVLIGGNATINAESDVRRTATITILPTENQGITTNGMFDLTERSKVWLNKNLVLYLGIKDLREDTVVYYKLGTLVIQAHDITYDATTNQMSINLSDLMTLLDGTVNGQVGALTTLIPSYKEDPDTGEVISYNVIRDAMTSVVSQLGNVSKYLIDDLGEFKAMKQYNEAGWQHYRNTHPLWNNVPYDLDFAAGCSVVEIIDTLRDIYPNNETFFDADGIFRCQMVPSMYYDDIAIPDYMLQRYIISENTNRDFTTVRNVSEVWGQILEADYFSEEVDNVDGVYVAEISGFDDDYMNKDRIALRVPSVNVQGQAININNYGNVTIYSTTTEEPIEVGTLEAGKVYVFMVDKEKVKKEDTDEDGEEPTEEYTYKFFLQGQWQIHAMCVLTDGTTSDQTWKDPSTGLECAVYSEDYFKLKYACDNVEMMINPESPFTVQKIGVRLAVYSGSDYDAIYTDDLARDRAHYENWKTARLTDNITLQTVLMPFLDVNSKVSYRMQNSTETKQYIIKNISHDFSGLTSSITMMTFYPLYESRSTNNAYDANLSLKGTQKFLSTAFVNAQIVERSELKEGDIVWVIYHGNYQTATVSGFGGEDKIGNKDVNGVPWVNVYAQGAENINNYLFLSKYRLSESHITNRYQKVGEFNYNIYNSTKSKIVATGSNDANGNIRFTSIDTSKLDVGNNTFYVVQTSGEDNTITYDTSTIPITVTITDDGDSRYYECNYEITFTNQY